MADAPGFETAQAGRREQALLATRERQVRWLLAQFETPTTPAVPYVEVLRRLQNALATEFHRVREGKDDDHAVLRPADGGVSQSDDPVPGP